MDTAKLKNIFERYGFTFTDLNGTRYEVCWPNEETPDAVVEFNSKSEDQWLHLIENMVADAAEYYRIRKAVL